MESNHCSMEQEGAFHLFSVFQEGKVRCMRYATESEYSILLQRSKHYQHAYDIITLTAFITIVLHSDTHEHFFRKVGGVPTSSFWH